MKDFEGKIIKVYFDQAERWVSVTGNYIHTTDKFLVIRDELSKRIKYINVDYIRSIEIVGDINE